MNQGIELSPDHTIFCDLLAALGPIRDAANRLNIIVPTPSSSHRTSRASKPPPETIAERVRQALRGIHSAAEALESACIDHSEDPDQDVSADQEALEALIAARTVLVTAWQNLNSLDRSFNPNTLATARQGREQFGYFQAYCLGLKTLRGVLMQVLRFDSDTMPCCRQMNLEMLKSLRGCVLAERVLPNTPLFR